MKSALGLAALSLMLAVPAHAQTSWSSDFNTTLQGSFDSASAPFGTIEVYDTTDGVLALPGTSTASFTFTTAAPTPFFLVSFWTSTNGGTDNGGTLNATLGSQTEGFTVPNPGATGPNPNPDGASYSYHFGGGTPWAAGTYTLTFDNAPSGGFRLDDVSVTAVPEPSAWALAMVAAVAVIGLARRRRGGDAVRA